MFADENVLGDLCQIAVAEVAVAKEAIEVCDRQHDPITVIRLVGDVVRDHLIDHRCVLRGKCFGEQFQNSVLQLLRQLNLMIAQWPEFKRVGENIVKTQKPRCLGALGSRTE